jgi:DNA replication protein DnaC
MLTSDFLAIDELGKERSKSNNNYMDSQIERIIKGRLDDNQPMLLATNMDLETLEKAYGPTISSILLGKFRVVMMEPGDYRVRLRERMVRNMGYE